MKSESTSLKILFMSSSFPYPETSGGQIRTMNFLRFFATQGKVTLLSPDSANLQAPYLDEVRKYCDAVELIDHKKFGPHSKDSQQTSAAGRFIDALKGTPWILRDFLSEEFHKKLLALDPGSFDVIFIRYPMLAFYFLTDPKLKRFLPKVVIDVDDILLIMQERRLKEMKPGYAKFRSTLDYKNLERIYKKLKSARVCFVTSNKDKDYMEQKGFSKNVQIVPNVIPVPDCHSERSEESVDSQILRQKAPQDDRLPTILFCGMLSFPHNEQAVIHFIKNILPSVKLSLPDVQFTVIGRNPGPELLKYNNVPGIVIKGNVPATEPFYASADIAVVPMLNGAGTKIKVLEAMSYRTPVVSSTIGAEGLDVEDGENILIRDEPAQFSEACIQLLKDKQRRERIAENGYSLVRTVYSIAAFNARVAESIDILKKTPLEVTV